MIKDYIHEVKAIQFLGNQEEIKDFLEGCLHHYEGLDLLIPHDEGELVVNETEKLIFGEPPIEVTRVESTYDEEIIEWEDLSEDEPYNELSKTLEDLDESNEVKEDISDILEF